MENRRPLFQHESLMRAVHIGQYGGPEVVRIDQVPVPTPSAGEVLVKVACAGINFMDVHTRMGKYATSRTYPVRLPCILGMEGSGTVVSTGEGAHRFKQGDRVAWCIAWGSYAEYASIPEHRLISIPKDISFEVAAATVFQGSTAHYLVHQVADKFAPRNCLVHAASGMIGQMLVQMAKAKGMTVFATASTADKCDLVRRLGADTVMFYEGFADKVLEMTDGAGVDVVFDSVGKDTLRESFRCARTRGLVINYGEVSGVVNDLAPIELGENGSLFLTRPRLADHLADVHEAQRRADEVFDALKAGALTVAIEGEYAMDDILEVHERLENRTQIGKAIMVL